MAITPADRKNYDERLRQTREEYDERESESVKRKNKDVKRLEQRHQAEIKKLTEAYDEKLDQVQNRSREVLTNRDRKHNEDVEEVRSTFMNSLRKQAEDAANEKRQIKDTYESEIDRVKEVTASQRNDLSEKQAAILAQKDEQAQNVINQSRRQMGETIVKHDERLKNQFGKQIDNLQESLEEAKSRSEFEKKELKKAHLNQSKTERRQREYDNGAWSQRFRDTVEGMRESHNSAIDSRNELMAKEVSRLDHRYQNALENKSDKMDEANEAFRDSVNERLNTQVRSKQHQIKQLGDKLNNEQVTNQRRRSIERRALEDTYVKKWDDLYQQKEDLQEKFKDIAQSRVNNVINKNDDLMRRANRDYKSDLSLLQTQNAQDRASVETLHKDQLRVKEANVNNRVKKMQKNANEAVRVNADYYGDSLEQLRQGFQEKVSQQRDVALTTRAELTNTMMERFRDMERRYENKIDSLTTGYEEKISGLKEKAEKDIKRQAQSNENLMKDREKGHKIEQESLRQKYETKIAMKEEEHEIEKEKMAKKHEEDVRSIASRMSSYSRKA